MFDIGFPELLLVSVIALIVIGPEKLRETIRTLSLWLGRLKRSLATIKSEIEAEIGADDIRRQLREESVLDELKDTKKQLDDVINTTRQDLNSITRSATSITEPSDAGTTASKTELPDGVAGLPDTGPQVPDSLTEVPDSQPALPGGKTAVPDSMTELPDTRTESNNNNPDPDSQNRMRDDSRGA